MPRSELLAVPAQPARSSFRRKREAPSGPLRVEATLVRSFGCDWAEKNGSFRRDLVVGPAIGEGPLSTRPCSWNPRPGKVGCGANCDMAGVRK